MLRREVFSARAPAHRRGFLAASAWHLAACTLALTGVFYALVAIYAAGCDVVQEGKDLGADVGEVVGCPFISCGQVFQCAGSNTDDTPWGPDELCWTDDSATELADASGADSCVPTPRGGQLGWPCLWCTKGRGANAFQGSWGCN